MRKRLPFLIAILCIGFMVLGYLIINPYLNPSLENVKKILGESKTAAVAFLTQDLQRLSPALAAARATHTELQKVTKLCIGGDINLAESMAKYIADGEQPFIGIAAELKTCDLHIANLETNVANPQTGTRQNKNYAFKAPPSTLSVLKDANVAGVSLANNHTMDYGPDALVEQIQLLNAQGIKSFGAGNNTAEAFAPTFFASNGNELAFIGINDAETGVARVRDNRPGSAYLDQGKINASIAQAKQAGAITIILPHWGNEHQLIASSKQRQWAKIMIDGGADLIVGAHPHVRQNTEEYKGKHIFYSIGNYVFSGFADRPEAQKSILLEVYIYKNEIKAINPVQLELNWFGFPTAAK